MNRRLIAAFLAAPLITSAVFGAALFSSTKSLKGVVIIFLLYAAVAFIAEAILGLPAYFIYRRFHWEGFIAYGLGGTVIGLISILFVAIIYSPFTRVTLGEFALCVLAGAIAGLSFRFVAGGKFKDRRQVISGEI
jgi:hypothetical protein